MYVRSSILGFFFGCGFSSRSSFSSTFALDFLFAGAADAADAMLGSCSLPSSSGFFGLARSRWPARLAAGFWPARPRPLPLPLPRPLDEGLFMATSERSEESSPLWSGSRAALRRAFWAYQVSDTTLAADIMNIYSVYFWAITDDKIYHACGLWNTPHQVVPSADHRWSSLSAPSAQWLDALGVEVLWGRPMALSPGIPIKVGLTKNTSSENYKLLYKCIWSWNSGLSL